MQSRLMFIYFIFFVFCLFVPFFFDKISVHFISVFFLIAVKYIYNRKLTILSGLFCDFKYIHIVA